MNINILHLSSERSWRGGEQQIAYLVEEQINKGLNVLVAVKKGSKFESYCLKNSINHFSLPFKNSMDLNTAWRVKNICLKNNINLLHMHSSKSHGVGVLSSMLGNRTAMILSRRVDFVPKANWITKWKYNHRSIKKILCVSDKIRDIMQTYVNSPDKCITIHSGILVTKFNQPKGKNHIREEFAISADTVLIGNTSALEAHKDYFTFLDTISLLVKKKVNVKALIIGTGAFENPLKEYVEHNKIKEHVIFTGFRNDINKLLPCLDVFMITSTEEGLGTSVLDAFAARIPVVATNAGGIPEMVVDHETGILAPIGNSEALSAAVEEILRDKHLKDRLIQNAYHKVSNEFTKELTAEKTLTAYKDVLLK